MTTVVSINGTLFAPAEARVSVFDRGLLYGDSVFETIGTYQGRPFALDEHLQRLRHSAELVYIELGVPVEALREEVLRAIRAGGHPESYVRLIVTRGQGELGLDPSLATEPCRIVVVTELHRPPPEDYARGIGTISYLTQRAADATEAAGAKIGNYLVAVLAMRRAKQHGAKEALILDRDRRVLEGATSNVFVVRGGQLTTPPLSLGILPGITRGVVLQAAKRLGLSVEEVAFDLEDVKRSSEVFVTSSIRQMLAATTIDGVPVGAGVPGPVYHRLWSEFERVIEERC
jgi:branched-chain amino acid aminotransferase